ncbi:MAG: endonuclease/exonuclease/phosphatase family protein [Actinomycetota bacterium]
MYRASHPRTKRTIVGALLVVLTTLALTGVSHAAKHGLGRSPSHELLVVTANLDEVFVPQDVAHSHDMLVFAHRVRYGVSSAPDVLLLQEVTATVAREVAKRLSREIGKKYVVAVAPGPVAWHMVGDKMFTTETAILLNSSTMRRVGRGHYLTNTYALGDTAPGIPNTSKKVAYALAQQRSTGTMYALASLHFVPNWNFKSRDVSNEYKKRWADRVAHTVKTTYPRAIPVIGGDFNSPRCLNESARDCQPAPFWSQMTSGLRFSDTLFSYGQIVGLGHLPAKPGVDFIFAKAGTAAAGSDYTYTKADQADPAKFYSDHQFHWALIQAGP